MRWIILPILLLTGCATHTQYARVAWCFACFTAETYTHTEKGDMKQKANLKTAHVYEVKTTGALIYCPKRHAGTPVEHNYKGVANVDERRILRQCEFKTEEDDD